MRVVCVAVTMVMGILFPLVLQLWDRRRLSAEQRAQGWNFATWGGALYAFGPLSMLGWVYVTRPRWWRCLIAVPWTLAPLIALTFTTLVLEQQLLGKPMELEAAEVAVSLLMAAAAIALLLFFVELISLGWARLRRWRTKRQAL